MKKLFTLFAILSLSVATYAEYRYPDASTENSLRSAVSAAAAGDVIVLDGTYGNTTSGYITISKNLTIQVADGKTATIKPAAPIQISSGATIKFIGVKFDGTSIGSYDYLIRFIDDNANNVVEFEDCEFTAISKYIVEIYTGYKAKSIVFKNCNLHDNTSRAILNRGTTTSIEIKDSHFENFTNSSDAVIENYSSGSIGTLNISGCEFNDIARHVIYAAAGTSISSCEIDDCYFHDIAKTAINIGFNEASQACDALTVENSTFANITGSDYNVIYFSGSSESSKTASLSVDHCTFFKHKKRAIYWQKSTNLSVSNCIFAQPSIINYYSVECVGGTITKCLSYNSDGYSSAATRTGNLTGNPYFVNTTSGSYDFTPASFSPAHNADSGTKDLGDYQRWTSDDSAHPTTKNITSGSGVIKAAVESVWPGDEIVLAEGTYSEPEVIDFNKSVVLKAATSTKPIIAQHYYSKVTSGADVKFNGIKFDGSSYPASDYCFYPFDNTAGNELHLEDCEFVGFSNYVLYNGGSYSLDSLIVNNCYFHNNTKSSVIYFEKHATEGSQTVKGVKVTNSTFANNSSTADYSVIFVRNQTGTTVSDVEVTVDHCTFYNNPTTNSDHSSIRSYKSTKVSISNCIFAHPEAYARRATSCYGGSISNCLTYNLTSDASQNAHRQEGGAPTLSNNTTGDPLFNDLANNNYTYDADWSTGSISPAWESASDGTHLGDPRWYSNNEVIPSTSITTSYDLLSTKAQLTGEVKLNANSHIEYKGTSTPGTAKWKLHVNNTCAVSAVAKREAESTSGCTLTLTVKDAEGNNVGAITAARSDDANDINFPGTLYFPEEGDYTIILTNSVANSSAKLEKIILSYAGGAVQTITNTANFETDINEAWFSANGTRADSKISFPGASMASAWVRWNVRVANSDFYDITVNFDKGDADHNCGVKLYNDLTTVFDKHATTSTQTSTASPIRLGRFYIPSGDYIMEFTNPVTNSTAKLISVEAEAFDAPTIDLPGTLDAADAMTSELAYEDGGELYFVPSGKEGQILDQWAQWKVSVASDASTYLFTMEVSSSETTQTYKISILDSETNEIDYCTRNPGSGDKTLKHYFYFAEAGTYYVKVQNTTKWSNGHAVSFAASNTPAEMITISEEDTSNEDWVDKVVDKDATSPKYTVQLIRTLRKGMYNTFCSPFAIEPSLAKNIFGEDAEIYTLKQATVEDDYILNLELQSESDVWQGTPVFIKPARDIVNPVFEDVVFKRDEPATTTKTNANFAGTFVKTTLGPSQDILFLAQNNMLYYPTAEIDILGFRGWFVIHDTPVPAGMIQRANIIDDDQSTNDIRIIKPQNEDTDIRKVLQNGQLYIIRDNAIFNVQGQRVK